MAIKTDVMGMVYDHPDYFIIGREKLREYAAAIKSDDPAHFDEAAAAELGHQALVAPPTFISTLALIMQRDFFRKVDTGFETMQIVQVDQKFLYHKPMLAGDKVWGRMEVISVNERFGADIVQTRNLALDENHSPHLGGCGECRGVVTINSATGEVTPNVEYYALAHASRFVRPGAVLVASTASDHELETVAFRNADDQKALIVLNVASSAREFAVRAGGQGFVYSLPAGAVVTFVWR